MVADADRARARMPVTSMQILSRRMCRTFPWVHLPAEKKGAAPLAVVGKIAKRYPDRQKIFWPRLSDSPAAIRPLDAGPKPVSFSFGRARFWLEPHRAGWPGLDPE